MTLTTRILIAMVSGIALGSLLNLLSGLALLPEAWHAGIYAYLVDGLFDVLGRVFIASLMMLVVPLVFVSLICGASALGNNARMGSIALRTITLYLLTTAFAVTMALMIALMVGPGEGVSVPGNTDFAPQQAPPLKEVLINMVPTNPVQAMADGEMLQVIVFALLLGYAITRCGKAGERLTAFFRDLEAVIMKIVKILMMFAPIGVFALLSKLFAELGVTVILDLARYFLTLLAILLLHGFGVYSLLLKSLAGLSPAMLLYKMRPVWAFAFSTASSGATIPVTMRTVEKRLGGKVSVAGFTVPLGATINMDGTAIMQGVATVFIAQVYGIDLTISALATVVLTATLASIGTAAVPGVGLITLSLVLQQAGLPVEGVALIIGVDRILDMVRTAVNVTGDATVSLIVAKREGQFDQAVFDDPMADLEAPENPGNGRVSAPGAAS
ncbi:MAG: dicarboxylate/amino acid:cation symporter [Halieaceae bacterium]|nr:dicarboxylate/amino acid:cation symporter [Halieaceae bacterium]